jgi:hypothetical protein
LIGSGPDDRVTTSRRRVIVARDQARGDDGAELAAAEKAFLV